MADNYAVTQGSGTTMASDDVAGVHYPIVKMAHGAADSATMVSSASPLPITESASQVDDAAFTPASSRVLMVGAEFDNVASDSVDEGDGGALRMSANRALHATLRDAAGNERGANVNASNQLEVSATLAAGTNTNEVVGDVAHDAPAAGNPVLIAGKASAAAPTDVSADGDAVTAWRLRNGAEAVVITAAGALVGGDAANGLDVDVTRLPALVAGSAKIGGVDLDSDATPGSAVPAAAQYVAGTDGTNARGLKTDTSGELQVDVLTVPANVRTTDTVSAALATDAIMSSTTALTPKFAAIAAASSGDNTLVAAVSSKKIRVLAMMIVATSAVSLYFTSAAGGTVIFGGSTNKIAIAANGGFSLPFSPVGWFENSSVTQALIMNLSSGVAVSGGLVYVEV